VNWHSGVQSYPLSFNRTSEGSLFDQNVGTLMTSFDSYSRLRGSNECADWKSTVLRAFVWLGSNILKLFRHTFLVRTP
jgi:hypothetical protein